MDNNSQLTIAELFGGCRGLGLGFEQAGFKTLYYNDIMKGAIETAKLHLPSLFEGKLKDGTYGIDNRGIENVMPEDIPRVNWIIGGPPCKGISKANRRTNGEDNAHNKCINYFVDIIDALSTRKEFLGFTFENSDQFINIKFKKFHDYIYSKLDSKFSLSETVLDAKHFETPMERKRCFIIGYKKRQIKFPAGSEVSTSISDAWENVSIHPNHKDTESNYISSTETTKYKIRKIPQGGNWQSLPYRTLESEYLSNLSKTIKNKYNISAPSDLYKKYTEIATELSTYKMTILYELLEKKLTLDKANTILKKHLYKNRQSNILRRLKYNGISPSITNIRKSLLIHPTENRIISIGEALKLLGFPDDYEIRGKLCDKTEQVGNSVAVPLARAIAQTIVQYIREDFPEGLPYFS